MFVFIEQNQIYRPRRHPASCTGAKDHTHNKGVRFILSMRNDISLKFHLKSVRKLIGQNLEGDFMIQHN